jgi:hypothetical protein
MSSCCYNHRKPYRKHKWTFCSFLFRNKMNKTLVIHTLECYQGYRRVMAQSHLNKAGGSQSWPKAPPPRIRPPRRRIVNKPSDVPFSQRTTSTSPSPRSHLPSCLTEWRVRGFLLLYLNRMLHAPQPWWEGEEGRRGHLPPTLLTSFPGQVGSQSLGMRSVGALGEGQLGDAERIEG